MRMSWWCCGAPPPLELNPLTALQFTPADPADGTGLQRPRIDLRPELVSSAKASTPGLAMSPKPDLISPFAAAAQAEA